MSWASGCRRPADPRRTSRERPEPDAELEDRAASDHAALAAQPVMTSCRSIEIKLGAQLLRRNRFFPSVCGQSLSGNCVLVRLRHLIIKRRRRKGVQHWVITPPLDDHQCGLSLLLGKLIDQLVESLLRRHRPMVPAARINWSVSATTGLSPRTAASAIEPLSTPKSVGLKGGGALAGLARLRGRCDLDVTRNLSEAECLPT